MNFLSRSDELGNVFILSGTRTFPFDLGREPVIMIFMRNDRKLLVFTDLDGTLMDFYTYSFSAAMPALARMGELEIPLVIVSSKTRSEIEFLLEGLPFRPQVFVSENGNAIYIQENPESEARVIELGMPYRKVLEGLHAAQEESGTDILGFSDMTVREISDVTGLDAESASRAKDRQYTEPFLLTGNQDIRGLREALGKRGLMCIEGGRFWHAMGRCDKGMAVGMVLDFYRDTGPDTDWQTVGLGDSPNDFSMLEAVDTAVLAQRHDGGYADYRPRPGQMVIRAPGKGPEGWNRVVLELIEKGS
jgi:mannosyl-3-phosphoglycerate phosphatase